MALNGLASPFLQAGFYYKTFMGPRKKSWMTYEPFIRRAAGLGRATREPDPDRYETRHAFADVLVVGAGPAGLSAALTAARGGCRVVLVEQDRELGGALLAESASDFETWRIALVGELKNASNVVVLTRATAIGLYDSNLAAILEKHDHLAPDPDKGEARQIVTLMRARAIVLACGAIERPLVFPGNDRPGVMLAGAARSYLNRHAVMCGRRVVVAANNDSAWRAAIDLAKAGAQTTLADVRDRAGAGLAKEAAAAGVEILMATAPVRTWGWFGLRQAALAPIAGGGSPIVRECDLLCMSGGWSPVVHLASHGGVKPRFDAVGACFVPGDPAPGQFHAGAITGSLSLGEAIRQGVEAGQRAAQHAGGRAAEGPNSIAIALEDGSQPVRPIWQAPMLRAGKAFVDFQNDVAATDIAIAHQEGYRSVEHLKRYTTQGMGTDQGKTSNVNALALMAGLRGLDIAEVGSTTFRPPYTPVAIGAIAGRTIGRHFRPVRRSPLHAWHLANGGEMIEAGPWLRAWYYRWAGADAAEAYVKEMELVRRGVGISDVSSLGKIDVQGPDAAAFLNRLYVNGFAKLDVGKARYGVMLHDDGLVLDDGTTTRLSDTRFFMTTTTAQAGEVMSWLEFLLQTAWPELRVHVTSLTDEWAGMAVSGPKAREALSMAFPGVDFSTDKLPYMGALDIDEVGVPIRFIRLSFSGELAYEVYCPADHAIALWERLLDRGAPLGIRPYGLEALASLRIEKGHVAGLELDHRNNLDDLGLGKMAAKEKAYVGKALRHRPAERPAERWSLVGIEALDAGARLRGGSILFKSGEAIKGHGRGYITSVTWSTELNKFIALGLYQGGLTHVGEEIVCAFPLKNETTRARIVSPHFIDPKGERLHA
jgi:sarcosine oxidase subunit alpha